MIPVARRADGRRLGAMRYRRRISIALIALIGLVLLGWLVGELADAQGERYEQYGKHRPVVVAEHLDRDG